MPSSYLILFKTASRLIHLWTLNKDCVTVDMLQYYILDCTQLTKLVKAEGEIYVIIAAWFLGSRNENFSESLGFCCCSFFERKCGKTCRTCKAHRVCAPTFRMPCLGKKKKKIKIWPRKCLLLLLLFVYLLIWYGSFQINADSFQCSDTIHFEVTGSHDKEAIKTKCYHFLHK